MAQKNSKNKERQIGKTKIEKNHLIDPKYKNTVWTIIILVILLIFFIINNTKDVSAAGPYPPNYNPSESHKVDTVINEKIRVEPK
ncbi:MAG: hypothetical protein ABI550_05875 [Ignavibacteriaceae bacterium]